MDGALPSEPMSNVPQSGATPLPSGLPASAPSSRISLAIALVIGLVVLGAAGLLWWQNRLLRPPGSPKPPAAQIPAAEVTQEEATPVQLPPRENGLVLSYTLPPGWTQQPAEGELTPYYTFLNRLRSPDNCSLVVTARIRTDNLSLSEFLAIQYPGSTLLQLSHFNQYKISGLESFTVKPQAEGESFSTYIQENGHVYGIFASYSLDAVGDDLRCQSDPPELAQLMESVKLQ